MTFVMNYDCERMSYYGKKSNNKLFYGFRNT